MEARAYRDKQQALGNNISFSEAVDSVLAMESGNGRILKPSESQTAMEARAYHDKQRALGNNISFSEAVDSVLAMESGNGGY